MKLDRNAILAKLGALSAKAVEVPELGGTLYVRPLSLGGMSRMQALMKGAPEDKDSPEAIRVSQVLVPVAILIDCLCDETGARIFSPGEDEAVLENLPSAVVQRLVDEAQHISGIGEKNAEAVAAGE